MNSRRCLCTAGARCTPTTISAALEHDARRSTLSLEQIAAHLGVSGRLLARWTNPDCREHFPAERLAEFMQLADAGATLRVICQLQSGAFVRLPDGPATPEE